MLIDIDTSDAFDDAPAYINESEKIDAQSSMKIGVFRALQLGDLLCSIPAFRALRKCYPKADIALFGLPWAKQLVNRFPNYIDAFIHFPGYPGLPEQNFDARATRKFLAQVQDMHFDLILQMQGNGTLVNPLIEMMGAKFSAGFYTEGHYYTDNGLFTEYPDGVHEVERHLQLMKHLGVEPDGNELEFTLYEEDWQALRKLDLPLAYKNYVCIHAGSRGGWRQWPPEYFAALADYCIMQNLQVVLTGTADELPIVRQVKKHMKYEPIIVAGKTSIGAAAALIKNAFALVANCTGVSHIASALQTPSVIISMDGEPNRWAPLNTHLHTTIDWTKTPAFDLVFDALQQMIVKLREPLTSNHTGLATNFNNGSEISSNRFP